MTYRGIKLATLCLLAWGIAWGQSAQNDTATTPYWVDMMQDANGNFYQTQRAFYQYWDGRSRDKADGFKPFKRWEWFMQYEINPDGSYISADQTAREVRAFRKKYGQPSVSKFAAVSGPSTWEALGPLVLPVASSGQPNGMGRVNCIAVHPQHDSTLFIGSPNGGIWRSYDLGKTWASNTDTNFIMQVSSIVFDTKSPNTVYAGTGDRDAGARSPRGVMKSTDGGLHWTLSNTGMGNKVVGMMIMDPNHPDTIVAATSGGIYKTTNGGANWSRRSSGGHFKDIVSQPGNFQVQYATSSGVFFRSTDGGDSWQSVTSGLPGGVRGAIAVTPADSNYVYFILTNQRSFKGLYFSQDAGQTFVNHSTSPNIMDYSTTGSGTGGQAWYDLDIAADPKNANTIYVGGVNIFKSTNQGRNWQINAHWTGSGGAPAVHADQHFLEFNPNGDRLLVGNDGECTTPKMAETITPTSVVVW
ncbi:hypothetical protein KFE98_07470 [bacterium SCSIO 12741]|nr:hypothetical protein KFE98_07470 [bacterium SCSIO 12741]